MIRSNPIAPARAPADATSGSAPTSGAALDYGALPGFVGFQLRRAQTRFAADFAQRLAEFSVTPGQLGLLLLIDGNPGVSQTVLARTVGVERSTLGEFIDRFEARRLVERRGSASDRRCYALHLTSEGQVFVKAALPAVGAHEEAMLSVLAPAERATLLRLLMLVSNG